MSGLFNSASDDQLAVGISIVMLAGASLFVFISFHLGPAGRKQRANQLEMTEKNLESQGSLESGNRRERAA